MSKYNQQKISIASVRAGNVIGGGDWSKDRLVPDLMNSLLNDEKIKVRNPEAVRPWQFVLDPLNGYLLLAEKLLNEKIEFSGAWNFGPDENQIISVKTLLEKIKDKWKSEISVEFETSEMFEENRLILNCKKANKNLEWYPKIDIDSTISLIVDWYRNYQNNENMRKFTERQIESYLKL